MLDTCSATSFDSFDPKVVLKSTGQANGLPNLSYIDGTFFQAEQRTLFPNAMLGVHRDHAFAIIVEPRGPAAITEHIELYYASEAMCDEGHAALDEALLAAHARRD